MLVRWPAGSRQLNQLGSFADPEAAALAKAAMQLFFPEKEQQSVNGEAAKIELASKAAH